MGFLDELKRLARPYEDEEEEEEFDDFEPVSRSERMDRTGGDRLERKAPKAQDSTGPIFPAEQQGGQYPHHHPASGGAGQARALRERQRDRRPPAGEAHGGAQPGVHQQGYRPPPAGFPLRCGLCQ